MNQTIFMIAMELVAVLGVVVRGPVIAVAVYYLFSVLRPQYLWAWALPRDVAWSDIPSIAAMIGLVAYEFGLVPIGGNQEGRFRGFGPTHFIFLGFAFWICLSYFTAQDQGVAWPWLLEYLTVFVMFFVATLVIRSLDQLWLMFLVATWPLLYIAYHVNSLYVFDGRLDIYKIGLGGLDNNGAGLTLAMAVPLALAAWEATPRWWRWIYIGSVPIVLHAVLVSYSRGAMVSLIAVIPLMILRSRRRWQFLLVALALIATVPFLAGNEIRERFFTVSNYAEDESANARFDSWMAAVRIANDYPVLGVGIRNANLFSYQYGADMQGRTIHSQYLQILADEGYVGLMLYLGTLLSFFVSGWRLRRFLKYTKDPLATKVVAMSNGLEAAVVVFCIGGVFLSLEVFELPYLLVLLGSQLAVVARSDLKLDERLIANEARERERFAPPALQPAAHPW
jgi:probable O-glycosylation ligase (exosortase A-associated)